MRDVTWILFSLVLFFITMFMGLISLGVFLVKIVFS